MSSPSWRETLDKTLKRRADGPSYLPTWTVVASTIVCVIIAIVGSVGGYDRPSTPQAVQHHSLGEHPSYDGYYNNPLDPTQGATDGVLLRTAPPMFQDSVYHPVVDGRPNVRTVSQMTMNGVSGYGSTRGLSVLAVFFGQVLVEEMLDSQRPTCPVEYFNIPIPQGDPHFDPLNTGQIHIPFLRTRYDSKTGMHPSVPRQQVNELTPFLDGGLFYGTSKPWADSIRSFSGGQLKSDPSNPMMPAKNTIGLPFFNSPPPAVGKLLPATRYFLSGNPRGNENPMALSIHLLWFREHNRLARNFSARFPGLDDETLFQLSRRWVIALYQKVVFDEWVPAWINQPLPPYTGYNPKINPQIADVFQAAAMRFGHTLVPPGVYRRNDTCHFYLTTGNSQETANKTALRTCNTFFHAEQYVEDFGPEALWMGMASQTSEREDNIITPDLREFVFGPLQALRRDLMALNMQRGRDHGLPYYNEVRAAYGLPRMDSFEQICPGYPDRAAALKAAYGGNIDIVDVWAGGLMETTAMGPGPLFTAIILDQFTRVRDADRFYYNNTDSGPPFSPEDLQEIDSTRFSDILLRNFAYTPVGTPLQQDVFHTTGALCQQPKQLNGSVGSPDLEECISRPLGYDYFAASQTEFVVILVLTIAAIASFAVGLYVYSRLNGGKEPFRPPTAISAAPGGAKKKAKGSGDLSESLLEKGSGDDSDLLHSAAGTYKPPTELNIGGPKGKLSDADPAADRGKTAVELDDEKSATPLTQATGAGALASESKQHICSQCFPKGAPREVSDEHVDAMLGLASDVAVYARDRLRLSNSLNLPFEKVDLLVNQSIQAVIKKFNRDVQLLLGKYGPFTGAVLEKIIRKGNLCCPNFTERLRAHFASCPFPQAAPESTKEAEQYFAIDIDEPPADRRTSATSGRLSTLSSDILSSITGRFKTVPAGQKPGADGRGKGRLGVSAPASESPSGPVCRCQCGLGEGLESGPEVKHGEWHGIFWLSKFFLLFQRPSFQRTPTLGVLPVGPCDWLRKLGAEDEPLSQKVDKTRKNVRQYFTTKNTRLDFIYEWIKISQTGSSNPQEMITLGNIADFITSVQLSVYGTKANADAQRQQTLIDLWRLEPSAKALRMSTTMLAPDAKSPNLASPSGASAARSATLSMPTLSTEEDAVPFKNITIDADKMPLTVDATPVSRAAFRRMFLLGNPASIDSLSDAASGIVPRSGQPHYPPEDYDDHEEAPEDEKEAAGGRGAVPAPNLRDTLSAISEAASGSSRREPEDDPEETDPTNFCPPIFRRAASIMHPLFFATLFILGNILVFYDRYYYYATFREHTGLRRILGSGISVTRGAASAIMLNLSLALLAASVNLLAFVSKLPIAELFPILYRRVLHKWAGMGFAFWSLVHVGGHFVNFHHIVEQPASDLACLFPEVYWPTDFLPSFSWWFFNTVTGLTGFVLTVLVTVFICLSMPWTKPAWFVKAHTLFWPILVLTFVHGAYGLIQDPPYFPRYVFPFIVLFVIDRIIQAAAIKMPAVVEKDTESASSFVTIRLEKPYNFTFQPGQYVNVRCNQLSASEKPFTLASSPHENELVLKIVPVGPWTRRLKDLAQEVQHGQEKPKPRKATHKKSRAHAGNKALVAVKPDPEFYISGPYDQFMQDWGKNTNVVLVAGGSGITGAVSIIRFVAHILKERQPKTLDDIRQTLGEVGIRTKKLGFWWSTLNPGAEEWVRTAIQELEQINVDVIDQFFDCRIFSTELKFDMRASLLSAFRKKLQSLERDKGQRSLNIITQLQRAKLHLERLGVEDARQLLEKFAPGMDLNKPEKEHNRIYVYTVGSAGVCQTIDAACASNRAAFIHRFTTHWKLCG